MADRARHFQTGRLNAYNHRVTDHYSKVIEVLRLESEAVIRAADRLDRDNVDRAIKLLEAAAGKVIVTGVGKSGVIGHKMAQTLTSTGTSAVFVHASDALHGGLGVIGPQDVVIAFSNSGETDELLVILPALKHRGVPIIAIAGNIHSTLARAADVVIDASVDREACPLNLAPTTSTTVALALSDAIAMALMEAKHLTAEAFAANHPAGRLGKRLTLRVADLMHESPSIAPSAGWLEVVKAISSHALGAVNIVDDDRRLLGIVTDGDLRRTIERTPAEQLASLSAESMMTQSPIYTSPEILAFEALKLMELRPSQISVLPVVDGDDRCVGLLRIHDVVRSGL